MNKEDDGETSSAPVGPPPKAKDMGFMQPPVEHSAMPQIVAPLEDTTLMNSSKLITGSNMFKMSRGRNMRANYVDVMNPGGARACGPQSSLATPATSPAAPMATSSPQLFIPTPGNSAYKIFLLLLVLILNYIA